MSTQTTDTSNHYVKAPEFFHELLVSLNQGRATNRLGEMFMMVSKRYSQHQDFSRYYHLKDEFVGIGSLACVRAFDKFKPMRKVDDKGNPIEAWDGEIIPYDYKTCNNPFAFFTTTIRHAFLQFLKKEYGQSNIQNKMRSRMGLETTYGYEAFVEAEEAKELARLGLDGSGPTLDIDDQEAHGVGCSVDAMSVWDNYAVDDSLVETDEPHQTSTETE